MPAASPHRTCCGASRLTRTPRTPCCCPPTRTRSRPCWPTARTTASPWCPSAAAPAWSAAWTRSAASSVPSSHWTCADSTNCTGSTRPPTRPNSAPVSPGPTPSDCWANAVSHWATSRRASCSPPSAVSRPPAPRVRTRPATGGSTTWSAACGSSPRPACWTSAVPRSRPPGPDLRELFTGSEGVFGIITRVRLRVHPTPEATRYEAWSFPDFTTGAAALRAVDPDRYRSRPCCGCPTRPRPASTWPPRATSASRRSPAAAWRITVFEGSRGARREPARRDQGRAGGQRRDVAGRGSGPGVGARPVRRAVSARLAAGGGSVVRDARDGDQLVQRPDAEGRGDGGADRPRWPKAARRRWCCATFRMCIPPARRCTSPSSRDSAATSPSSGGPRKWLRAKRSPASAPPSPTITRSVPTTGRG